MVCFPFHFQFFVCFQIMCVGMIVTSVDGGKETFCNMFRDLFIPFYHYHLSKLYCYAQFIFSQTKGESRISAENLVQRIRQLTTSLLSQQYGLFFFLSKMCFKILFVNYLIYKIYFKNRKTFFSVFRDYLKLLIICQVLTIESVESFHIFISHLP